MEELEKGDTGSIWYVLWNHGWGIVKRKFLNGKSKGKKNNWEK